MAGDGTLAIEARGLEKAYGEVRALDGVDLAVPAGTILGVLGPNGAGKTTAVRILATVLPADGGEALTIGLIGCGVRGRDILKTLALLPKASVAAPAIGALWFGLRLLMIIGSRK